MIKRCVFQMVVVGRGVKAKADLNFVELSLGTLTDIRAPVLTLSQHVLLYLQSSVAAELWSSRSGS